MQSKFKSLTMNSNGDAVLYIYARISLRMTGEKRKEIFVRRFRTVRRPVPRMRDE